MPIKKNVVPALHPTEILPEPYSIILSDSLLYPFSSYTVSGRRNGYGGGGIWEPSETMVRGTIVVVIDNAGLDKAVIYVQTAGKRIICRGGDKRREIEEVFDIGDLLRLIHGGYDVRVNVTDINGNWATGKTHIDSALQTLKKGLSALLDMIVAALKVIAKVASMLLDVVEKMIMRMLNPILEPIKKSINHWMDGIKHIFEVELLPVLPFLGLNIGDNSAKASDLGTTRGNSNAAATFILGFAKVWDFLLSLSIILNMIFTLLIAIEVGGKAAFPGVALMDVLAPFFAEVIISVFIMTAISVSLECGTLEVFMEKTRVPMGFRDVADSIVSSGVAIYKKEKLSFAVAMFSLLFSSVSLFANPKGGINILLDLAAIILAFAALYIHRTSPFELPLKVIAAMSYLIDEYLIYSSIGVALLTIIGDAIVLLS